MRQKLFIFLVIVTLFAVRCKKETSVPNLEVEVAQVMSDSILMRYEFVTHLTSGYDAIIQPRVSGYLKRSFVKSGELVTRGDLLYVIDADLLNTSLRAAQSNLLSAQAKEREARNNYVRALPLAEQGAISESQMDEYKTNYTSARQAVQSAREQLENARLQVSYARIYSPINGIASYSSVHEGDYVGVGTQYPTLTTISNMDTLKAEISIPTSLYLRYAAAGRATYDNRNLLSDVSLYLDNGQEYKYKGIYDYTRQNISPTAGTISLVVDFPNPESYLKAGEYARIQTAMGRKRLCVLVPQMSVASSQGVYYVWVIQPDSTVQYRRVKLGEKYDSLWIVDEGLQANEVIALTGLQKLRNGEKVTPMKK